ncbi:uncharacterized protein DFL_005686 [Arthrobotrys flagrans]|uniref:Uncharacterized protein n=1 Tax=Arthrobotrys flagrans TaxID=97331 RepID=A0A436ZY79_ARTFL|nr:hypothetical protein DFL_005686 [Arthrobotrys flagrans]
MATSHPEATESPMDITICVDDGQVSPLPIEVQVDAAGVSTTEAIIADLAQRNLEKIRLSKELERNEQHTCCSHHTDEHSNEATDITTTTTVITVPEDIYNPLAVSVSLGEKSSYYDQCAGIDGCVLLLRMRGGNCRERGGRSWRGVSGWREESVVVCAGNWLCLFSAFGLVNAIASTGGGVGGIFFPLVVSHLLHPLGFAWTTRLFGLVYLATLGIALFLGGRCLVF